MIRCLVAMDHEAPDPYSAITPAGVSNVPPRFLVKSHVALAPEHADHRVP
jgi:hypothetical protein